MSDTIEIGIIGDFNPDFRSHLATNRALEHAANYLSIPLEVHWLPSKSLLADENLMALETLDGFWASPGSPYESMEGALRGIQFARERDRPFLGT